MTKEDGVDTDVDGESLGNCLSGFIDDGSIESHRYYLARRTTLEMLRDRGFAVPNAEIEVSLQEFRNKHGQKPDIDNLRITSLHRDDPSIKVSVFLLYFCLFFWARFLYWAGVIFAKSYFLKTVTLNFLKDDHPSDKVCFSP